MKIKLDTKRHCIETEIKKLYNHSIAQYFKPDCKSDIKKNQLEIKIEILLAALEEFDFAYLRKTYTELCGHIDANVWLYRDENNKIGLIINNNSIL